MYYCCHYNHYHYYFQVDHSISDTYYTYHTGLFTDVRLSEHSTVSRTSNDIFSLTNGFIIHKVLRNRVASVA